MKTFIYPEMMVHVPLCTHKNPQLLLVISDDAELIEGELARYLGIETVFEGTGNLLETLRNSADKSADIVLLDTLCDDGAVLAHVNRILKEDGLTVLKHPDLDDVAANTKLMQILGNYFKIIMPYYNGAGSTLLLCSKEYHPTADLILQRSDLLEGQQFYNCDVHIGVFAMPQYIRKNYLGIIRN
ncbi:MAG: spermidine synthase [Sulfuricurvum sp.]|jgi:spermidine synthase|uniref:spermidine synthase n=1 Tax=Sulfuricurvum sp. TaxID=2025608 RepID=UPI0025CC1E94|nr:spermidine synthase [Sulfuricurvum sp.]MCK9371874.1 spermidine synthase [Sulfuricurvum sp.]